MNVDLFNRISTRFVLWSPRAQSVPPRVLVGTLVQGNPSTLTGLVNVPMTAVQGVPDLWEADPAAMNLADGVYHYWFEVDESWRYGTAGTRVVCTDPFARAVDYRLVATAVGASNTDASKHPAAVVKVKAGKLVACDPGGEELSGTPHPSPDGLPPNNRLVIYEIPTAWSRIDEASALERGVGTFRDVTALLDATVGGANFVDLAATQPGFSYLGTLGVNAIELLPPTDSSVEREWGYAPSHFLAPDYDLGKPKDHVSPTAATDLDALVRACHARGLRFFVDAVMAFGRDEAFQHIDGDDFYISQPFVDPADPEAVTSTRGFGVKMQRDGQGSVLFRYAKFLDTYDPISGTAQSIVPARQLMFVFLARWMRDFRVDGFRIDSVENVANWDFVGGFSALGRSLWNAEWQSRGLGAGADERFLVVGEELSLPFGLLDQNRLDALWNEAFQSRIRAALIGEGEGDNFEWTVRKAIDCRLAGFRDGAQAVNYLTSHDTEGRRKERLATFFWKAKVADAERRIKLGFVCLLTAVGIPMILAGEEFADQNDRFDTDGNVSQSGGKQVDAVNYSRWQDPWRRRVFDYVARLVKLRTRHPALARNETEFLHFDDADGKRVVVWRRGLPDDPVIVVANFSDYGTPNAGSPDAEYRVPGWPAAPAGRHWREETQDRDVPAAWAGREPVFPWEAKVYTLA